MTSNKLQSKKPLNGFCEKIVLSAIAALTVASLSANAGEVKLYQNADGQVFTTPATDRTALNMSSVSGSKKIITIVNEKSPDFLLGKETHINMKMTAQDNSDMWLKAGVRIQGSFESTSTTDNATNDTTTLMDAYLRRVRFEVAAGFGKHASFTMDVRNDKANKGLDNAENGFNVGDAYLKVKKPFGTSLVNFKFYRAKIDVSRTETIKSARVVAYDRPLVADQAAQYISLNRRGTNAQMYGNWNKKIQYQIATGAATSPSKVKDA
ncbi:MAG: porin, partial [Sulfurimonas sp.]|nr:porin [Sulfurimonas sp.]